MKLILVSVFHLFVIAASQRNTGCPKLPVDPCTCSSTPHPYLTCDRVDNTEDLRQVFQNSAGTHFGVVHLTNCVLQYLPNDLFNNIQVTELRLDNSTFVELFDDVPKDTESLKTLHIENTLIFRGILWEHLEPMKHLRILNVYRNQIDTIGHDFAEYVPKSLEQLSFYDTKTSQIKPGIFGHFPLLDKVAVDHCELQELHRNMFPVPFNGRILYFNENLLTTLPADLFTDMPNLQTVGLRGNSISSIPPTMFATRFPKLEYFILEGNPLYCDYRFKWLVLNKPPVLKGNCFAPLRMHGLQLAELDVDQLLYDE